MTNRKIHEPAVQGDEDRPKKVAEQLSPVAHDLIALAVNGKQAHWHLRGASFISVHEFLERGRGARTGSLRHGGRAHRRAGAAG